MTAAMFVEMVGYLGAVLVVVSMLMTSLRKLRIVNAVGACIFTIYALLIQSYPTAFMNSCLVAIDVFHLIHNLSHITNNAAFRNSKITTQK